MPNFKHFSTCNLFCIVMCSTLHQIFWTLHGVGLNLHLRIHLDSPLCENKMICPEKPKKKKILIASCKYIQKAKGNRCMNTQNINEGPVATFLALVALTTAFGYVCGKATFVARAATSKSCLTFGTKPNFRTLGHFRKWNLMPLQVITLVGSHWISLLDLWSVAGMKSW